MARSSTTRKGARSEQSNALLEALKTIEFTQDKDGKVYEQFCRIGPKHVTATNGRLSVGIKIETGFEANPNTSELMKALKRTGEQVTYTMVSSTRLFIQSAKFECYIECVADEWLPTINPDMPCAKINNILLEALEVCSVIVDEKTEPAQFTGVLIDGYSCAATDRFSIFQFWHGIHLPSGLIIPKETIKALRTRDSDLTEFGFSNESVTFYFADGSFIKTGLLVGSFPNYARLLDQQSNQQPVPPDFWTGLRAILDFSSDGTVYFSDAALETHEGEKGAKYKVQGITKGPIYNGSRLKPLENYAKTIDFYHDRGAMFLGDKVRGIVARRS